MASELFAAIDVGSLTVRLAVAASRGPGQFQVLVHRREITGLGRDLARTGTLAPAAVERTVVALGDFLRELNTLKVEAVEAVATQAVRQAENREGFLGRLRAELGLSVRVLAPEEEARLTLAGVLTALAPEYLREPALAVFDVGGGSTEAALVQPGRDPRFASLPLGVLTVSRARTLGDPPGAAQVAALRQDLTGQLTRFYQEFFEPALRTPPRLVGTAGAVTTLAAMALKMPDYDPARVNNLILTREQVSELAELICRLPEAERAQLPGLEPAKAGVMVAGALIVLTLLEVSRQDSLVAIDAGLLEGVLSEMNARF